jgi:hypothetical protein
MYKKFIALYLYTMAYLVKEVTCCASLTMFSKILIFLFFHTFHMMYTPSSNST